MIVLSYILTVLFLIAGGAKVFKAKPMVEQFKEFGLPVGLVVVVGSLEVLGAIALQIKSIPNYYPILGLLLLMAGAIINHIKAKHNFSKILPSLLLFILSSILLITLYY